MDENLGNTPPPEKRTLYTTIFLVIVLPLTLVVLLRQTRLNSNANTIPVTPVTPVSPPITHAQQKPGDADGNNKVDIVDFGCRHSNFHMIVTGGPEVGNFNKIYDPNDTRVDIVDFGVWLDNFKK